MTNMTTDAALQQVLRRLDSLEARLAAPTITPEGDLLASAIHLRQICASVLPSDYFPDARWSILLDLYLAHFAAEGGRTESEIRRRWRLSDGRMQEQVARLVDDGYAEFQRDDAVVVTRLRLTRLGVMTMQAVFARTQGHIAEQRAAA